jgi:MFS transporter, DHA2 family, multidrug resistance protein
MLATFMEILDTTVVNVAIPHISGSLAASVDEGTWVVASSYMCRRIHGHIALLWNGTTLSGLIFFRVLQGLTGGGLQPLAQAILLETFPREKHGHAMAAYGVGILFAPILGPALGG